ncbi:unnamed protein product [Psylliodes chrysocephalus]|uniref:Cytochrome P450 n=1 Tax=Psylliodes chrysocephalus TaxID=3402493 RepID=A0A9P0CDJ2_9CUCU|nr:unnamed protein product [Psylliodes chrysocephala]
MFLTENIIIDLLGIFVALLLTFVVNHIWTLGYWKRRGVSGPEGIFLFGSMKDFFLSKKTMADFLKDLYNEYKSKGERYIGCYLSGRPIFVPIDLDVIKEVLVTHDNFDSHGFYYNENQPLTINVFTLAGTRWKEVRTKLTPSFTPGKIKMAYNSLLDCKLDLKVLLDKASKNNPVNIKDILVRFTIDVIGSSAFGLDIGSMKDSDEPSDFVINGNKVIEPSIENSVRFIIPFIVNHNILRAFNFTAFNQHINDFYVNTTLSTIKYREENNIVRNDFMNLLIQMKNSKNEHERLSISEIVGQSFVFYIAGFETSSTSTNFAIFELSQHQDIQDKLRQEINLVMNKYENQLTYEAVQEMVYLDQVVYESLRMHPPSPFLMRQCNKDYKVTGTDLTIQKGTLVFIPSYAIQYDPEYYPNPYKFEPERFNAENKKAIPSYSWLPFGEGPRICLGMRFGIQQMKIALITLIQHFKFSLNKRTTLPLKMSRLPFLMKTEHGIYIDLEVINSEDQTREHKNKNE